MTIYILGTVCYTIITARETELKKAALSGDAPRAAEGGEGMKYSNGKWSYDGKTYSTLYEALISAWPK